MEVHFLVPMSGGSQTCVTLAPVDLLPFSGFCMYLILSVHMSNYTHACTHNNNKIKIVFKDHKFLEMKDGINIQEYDFLSWTDYAKINLD